MNQEASWIGLGWELPVGEITRQVKGFPGDWNGVTVENISNGSAVPSQYEYEAKNCFGPLYFYKMSIRKFN